jgi:hypothetical protein
MLPQTRQRFTGLTEDRLFIRGAGIGIQQVYRQRTEYEQRFAQRLGVFGIAINDQALPGHLFQFHIEGQTRRRRANDAGSAIAVPTRCGRSPPVREERRRAPAATGAIGVDRVNEIRSTIPAVTHVDHGARLQTVDETRNPLLHRLLTTFERKTDCPVLINTSFNVRSEPIVCTPADAYRCFMATDMDVLVVGNFILHKDRQPSANRPETRTYLARFEID